jgi:hypothetical protein
MKKRTTKCPLFLTKYTAFKAAGYETPTAYFVGSNVPPQVLFCIRLTLFCKELVGIPKK